MNATSQEGILQLIIQDLTLLFLPSAVVEAASPAVIGGWKNRDKAYKTLELLANYLSKTEQHSPNPYLIRRAVNWGRMPLPELMAEIIREEGGLNKMMSLLGIKYQSVINELRNQTCLIGT